MTITKMVKQLAQLVEEKGADYIVYKWIDAFEYHIKDYKEEKYETKEPREVITLGDILKQFQNKQGPIFEQFSSTSSFREYSQWIKEGKFKDEEIFYEDSYNEYKKMWEADNPGKDYEVELKKQNEARKKRAQRTLTNMMGMYMQPLYNLQPFLRFMEKGRF